MNALKAIRLALIERLGNIEPSPVDEAQAAMVLAFVARHVPDISRDQAAAVEFVAGVLLSALDMMRLKAAVTPERPLSLRDGVAGVTKQGDPCDFGAAYQEEDDS